MIKQTLYSQKPLVCLKLNDTGLELSNISEYPNLLATTIKKCLIGSGIEFPFNNNILFSLLIVEENNKHFKIYLDESKLLEWKDEENQISIQSDYINII